VTAGALSRAELFARSMRPVFAGETEIGWMVVLAARSPVPLMMDAPLWALAYDQSLEGARERAIFEIVKQFPFTWRNAEVWTP
jgi:hypothetical protein